MNDTIERIKSKMREKALVSSKPVSPEEVMAFEQRNNIALPDELVMFYVEVCNGCEMIDGFRLRGLEELEFDSGRIKADFIFTKYWIWENDTANDDLLIKVRDGNMELIDIGDSLSWHIIMSGEEKGQMWFFTDVGIQPCAPGRGFLSWFEYWLDGNDNYFATT